MNTQESIRQTMHTSEVVLQRYISDLGDDDLAARPHPECNPLAWQLGHLVCSGCDLLEAIAPDSSVTLPDGFAENYTKEAAKDNDASKFLKKQEYLDLLAKVNEAATSALSQFSDEDLDRPSPEQFKDFFPRVGDIFLLIAMHPMMHAGQFVPVRRQLGKDVVM